MQQQSVRIAPSILSADFARLGDEVAAVSAAGADYVHVDVMDGHFVPNLTIGAGVVRDLRKCSDRTFDVHLMIEPVEPYLEGFAEAGADIITVHAEAVGELKPVLKRIRDLGAKPGVALKPATGAEAVDDVLDLADLILVMTVEPGFGGQSFMADQLAKIEAIRRKIDNSTRTIDLEVDGGVNDETACRAIGAGADVLVAGTAVFRNGPAAYARNIAALRRCP